MSTARIAAVVLAGGEGKRLGAPVLKPLVPIGGRSMIEHVLDRIPRWVAPVLIGANDAAAFAAFGCPVVPDGTEGRKGPLAGLDAAAAWLRAERPEITHLLSLPGDTPFLPSDLAGRLTLRPSDRPKLARFQGRLQPIVALWPLASLDPLAAYLAVADDLSLMRFAGSSGGFEAIDVEPSEQAPSGDPFFNVNTPDDLAEARAFVAG